MHTEELQTLRRLLKQLRDTNLDRPPRKPTFMEVAGIERREVTISRILRFLLCTDEGHGMGDLWVRSLLQAASDTLPQLDPLALQLSPATAQTEVVTLNVEANLRIDVVVETPDLVLGIENKIGAGLYNNLAAYAGMVRGMAGDRLPLLLTLTLHDEAAATNAWSKACEELGVSVRNVTYEALFGRVRQSMDDAAPTADPEWLAYTRDFMKTIENLGAPAMEMDRELFCFFVENLSEVELMRAKMEEVTRTTRTQGERLADLLEDDEQIRSLGLGRPLIWQPAGKCGLVCSTYYEMVLHGKVGRLHPEISNSIRCMRIQCWASSDMAKVAAKEALLAGGYDIVAEDRQMLVVKELPLETADEVLVEELKRLIGVVAASQGGKANK